MLPVQDILLESTPAGPRAVAAFDLSDVQLRAVAVALEALRRGRFAYAELDADAVLELAGLRVVTDQVEALAVAGAHGTLRLALEGVHLLAEAVGAYSLRDTDGYQPPEERERLELLRPLAGDLLDLVSGMHRARQHLADESQGD
jgi:hypothetical protein